MAMWRSLGLLGFLVAQLVTTFTVVVEILKLLMEKAEWWWWWLLLLLSVIKMVLSGMRVMGGQIEV
jgi:hypothetical protein